ncbi:FAD-dependent monooxygenase [Streptomyces sp. NPDC017979]|uniref:FAD-dependent monooxygenase n=1 Tax=Streptomyces sp. NPDC017979 TaxID=3365024 RepID=UPI0037BC7EBC
MKSRAEASAAVVGGSIGGCAAALALHRAGFGSVTVHERTDGDLADRGVGIGVHGARYEELAAAGFLDAGMAHVALVERRWYVRDGPGPGPGLGRRIRTDSFPFRTYAWGPLWRELRARVPGPVAFHQGSAVLAVEDTPVGAEVRTADGRTARHDLVIGADGYRSTVRDAVCPRARPGYAGYLAWRGAYPEERLPDGERWPRDAAAYVVFPGGHAVIYRIPDGAGGRRVNWVLYAAPPPGLDLPLTTPTSLPPGTLSTALRTHIARLAHDHLPSFWGRLIEVTEPEELFVQPMYDVTAEPGVTGRLALLGDAATIARPHTGAGAVKALQDAALLEAALSGAPDPAAALARYDSARAALGRTMVDLGRRLGAALVTSTPDWPSLDGPALAAWWQRADATGAFGGRRLPD